jgi:hypothetical protein
MTFRSHSLTAFCCRLVGSLRSRVMSVSPYVWYNYSYLDGVLRGYRLNPACWRIRTLSTVRWFLVVGGDHLGSHAPVLFKWSLVFPSLRTFSLRIGPSLTSFKGSSERHEGSQIILIPQPLESLKDSCVEVLCPPVHSREPGYDWQAMLTHKPDTQKGFPRLRNNHH